MLFVKSKKSPVFAIIFIFRYLGLFPYDVIKRPNKNSELRVSTRRSVLKNDKLVLNLYLFYYSLFLVMMVFLLIIIHCLTAFNIVEENKSTETVSYLMQIVLLSILSILNMIYITFNINKLMSFINLYSTLFHPKEVKMNLIFTVCVLSSVGFSIEHIIRQAMRSDERKFSYVIKILIYIFRDVLFRVGHIFLFYSINSSLSNQWNLLRSSNHLKFVIPNLDYTIKISDKLVKCQHKCNDLFANIISISLITNILSIIAYSFFVVLRCTTTHYKISCLEIISMSLLLTVLICDVSENLNNQVSFSTYFSY